MLPLHYHVAWGFYGCLPEDNVAFLDEDAALEYLDTVLEEYTEEGHIVTPMLETIEEKLYDVDDNVWVQFYACTDDGDVCREAFEEEG